MPDKGSGYRILSIPLAGRCHKIPCRAGVLLDGQDLGYRVQLFLSKRSYLYIEDANFCSNYHSLFVF